MDQQKKWGKDRAHKEGEECLLEQIKSKLVVVGCRTWSDLAAVSSRGIHLTEKSFQNKMKKKKGQMRN